MDFKTIINWFNDINGIVIVSIITNIGLFIKIIRDGKMLPKDLKGADLDNRTKELSLADMYDEIATKAAEKVMKMQEKYDGLEVRFDLLENDQKILKRKVEDQDILLLEYSENSVKQNKKVEYLECQLSNYEKYNSALIQQIRKEQLIPVEMKTLPLKNCEKILEV
jgi:hypothetical protein